MYQILLDNIHADVTKKLANSGIDINSVSDLPSIFDANGMHGNIFRGFHSHYLHTKFCQEYFHLVEPQSVVLGVHRKARGTGSKRRCVSVNDEMMYVPLLSSLQAFNQHEAVISDIERQTVHSSGIIEDYCDGEHYKSHPLFSTHTNGLQLFIYYDDVEICNPLGSKRTKHKVGFFYYLLGNLSPKHRSQLGNIQLITVVKKSFISKYGMNAILETFLNDVKKLEEGVVFEIDGTKKTFHGTIVSICADNLGANALGGFKEGSSAYRGCRQCLMTSNEMSAVFKEDEGLLRTLNEHEKQCDRLETEEYDKISKEFGINRRTIFMQLKYVDICSGILLPDIMHDVLEGSLQYEVKLALRYFIFEKKYFKASKLQKIMNSFELGYMEVQDRPTPIDKKILKNKDNSLRQNASQMWLLGRMLPCMIGNLIPDDDEKWKNLMLLLQIVDLLFAPQITSDEEVYLEMLIEQHHQTFIELYPMNSVIPKMHYLIHAARLILKFGPLIRHWTMRFEARHKYFKRLAARLGNFINIAHTLANRYQQLQCYYSLDTSRLENEMEIGSSEWIELDSELSSLFNTLPNTRVLKTNWIKLYGTLYKPSSCVVIDVKNDLPVFGEIIEIFLYGEDAYFVIYQYSTLLFSEHFHAYLVKKSPEKKTLHASRLRSFTPLHFRNVKDFTMPGHKAVVLKYHISYD